MTTIRLNERALQAAGLDRVTVEALRHLVRQVGEQVGAVTLPEVAEQTDVLNPVIVALQLADAAIRAQAAILEAEQSNLVQPDRQLWQQIEDLAAEVHDLRLTNTALQQRIDDLENRVN